MIKFNVKLENLTTDEALVSLCLPMEESDIRYRLMNECDYLIVEHDSPADFENFDDVFELNRVVNRICSENPAITNKLLSVILSASYYSYFDNEQFLDKLCSNDFMYKEVRTPPDWDESDEAYAAYSLFTEENIPFSVIESEMDEAKKQGKDYGDWYSVWDVYSFMGFHVCEDEDKNSVIYIVNIEDSE